MKKNILIFTLLVTSNIAYADLLSVNGSNKISTYQLDKLSQKLSKGVHTSDEETIALNNSDKPQKLSDSGYVYMYKDTNGVTSLRNKASDDTNLKLIKVTKVGVDQRSIISNRSIIVNSDGTWQETTKPYIKKDSQLSTDTVKVSENTIKTNVTKYYKSMQFTPDIKHNFEYLKPGEEVKIVDLSLKTVSHDSLAEDGYKVIGFSKFLDRKLLKNDVVEQAKKVGASLVTFDKSTNSKIYYTKQDDPNNFDIIYIYEIVFYVKNSSIMDPNSIGLNMTNIPIDERSNYQRNTGVYISSVIRNSKAYNANILSGDVITSINNIPILQVENFNNIKNSELEKNKILNLKIIRIVKNDLKEIEIPINFR